MPGMNSGLNIDNPAVVAAFRSALLHQGLAALLIFAVLGAAWIGLRAWLRPSIRDAPAAPAVAEPADRLLLAIGFGNLWLFDGFLQAQPAMPAGLPSEAIEPTAASSPSWVQHVVDWAGTSWSYHPVPASAAAVWIQVGLGILAAGGTARRPVPPRRPWPVSASSSPAWRCWRRGPAAGSGREPRTGGWAGCPG